MDPIPIDRRIHDEKNVIPLVGRLAYDDPVRLRISQLRRSARAPKRTANPYSCLCDVVFGFIVPLRIPRVSR